MKILAKTELKDKKEPKKVAIISVVVSEGFKISDTVVKNVKSEISTLTEYVISKMKEE